MMNEELKIFQIMGNLLKKLESLFCKPLNVKVYADGFASAHQQKYINIQGYIYYTNIALITKIMTGN